MPLVAPHMADPDRYFYPQALDSVMHPVVQMFFGLSNEAMARRYCALRGAGEPGALLALLGARQTAFHWAGADLFPARLPSGDHRMIVLEINSCPSGQKSLPLGGDGGPYRHYRRLIERTFLPLLAGAALPAGAAAVIHDKNAMEAAGYAAALASALGEPVRLIDLERSGYAALRCRRGVLEAAEDGRSWQPIRAAFRYVTQNPWRHIPAETATLVLNPIAACLAGGRNKLLAAAAYAEWNAAAAPWLRIQTPRTIGPVRPAQIPALLAQLGGLAVVKTPYGNGGQGVHTIVGERELAACLAALPDADCVVQELIGHPAWGAAAPASGYPGRLAYAVSGAGGRQRRYAMDLRMMVGNGPAGFYPAALYGRRARAPLAPGLPADSWAALGTNLSVRRSDGSWHLESERLIIADAARFDELALELDDLVESYVQTALAARAVDRMAERLLLPGGGLDRQRLHDLNPDPRLLDDLWRPRPLAANC